MKNHFKMVFKSTMISLCSVLLLVSSGTLAAPDLSIMEILEMLQKFSQYQPRAGDVYSSESVQETSRMKPIAAQMGPALGDIVEPVAWPYPPAPSTGGSGEFPLLERFMKQNNIQSNNQISNTPSQLSWSPPPQPQQAVRNQPAPIIIPSPSPVQWSPPKQQNNINSYVEYGLLQPQPIKPMSAVTIPPPLDPNQHFQVQHSNGGQQMRHFRLDSVRMADNSEQRDKLNVSFVMPPDVKPLTLNFDTSEVLVDTGDKQQPVERVYGQSSIYTNLDELLKKAQSGQGASGSRKEENDDDYIVVRHDMNKYAYDLPKPGSSGSAVESSAATVGTQTPTVEKYDVSGQKQLRFTLGRVSG